MYEVWVSDRVRLARIARFKALDDALRFAERQRRERAVAIRQPDGRWYRDPGSGRSILETR